MNHHLTKDALLLIILIWVSLMSTQAQDLKKVLNEKTTDTIPSGQQGSSNPLSDNKDVLTGDDLLDSSFPNSWPLFGTGVRMSIGGYVKGDFIRDFDYLDDRYEFELGSIALEGSPNRALGGISTFHGKETRINFDFRSSANFKNEKKFPLQVFLELDWFFDSDDLNLVPRLRHAYGVIGNLLVGQTWTTSFDSNILPSTVDFSGGDARYGGRSMQIRWQDNINKTFSYAVALEGFTPQIDNVQGLEGASRPLWPNLAAMIKAKSRNGSSIQLGLDIFPVSWVGPSTVPNTSKTGYAVTVSSILIMKVTEYQDAFVWAAGYGKGQGHRLGALSWDGKASGVLAQNSLNTSPAWFALAGFNHYWSKSLNSNISVNWNETTLSNLQTDDTIKSAGSIHANLIYFPHRMVSTGLEYMWGVRENKNGVEGTASRVQFMVKFKFN